VLSDLQIIKSYNYEIILDDGTKTTFTYGGDKPLSN
jgi:hypothetical protein